MAMPAVLGTLVVSALLAGAVAHQARSTYRLDVEHHRRSSDEWIVQAGLNRAVKALVTPGDPMREALFGDHSTTWTFGEARISLAMSEESKKVDLNAADPEVAMGGVALALPGLSQEGVVRIAARLAAFRARHQGLLFSDALLPLDERSWSTSNRLQRFTTTLSGQKSPSALTPDREDEASGRERNPWPLREDGGGPPSRPIYRVTATMMAANGVTPDAVPLSASVVVVLSVNDARTFKVAEGHL
jgi:hypothetical protein